MNREAHETHMAGPIIPGEYNRVASATRDVDSLLLVHAMPCDKKHARRVINLAMAHLAPTCALPRILFSSRVGRATYGPVIKREVAYVSAITGKPRYRRKRTGDQEYRISLPRQPRPAATANAHAHGWQGLRVGVVLHELAHILECHEHGKMGAHGALFTETLDRLVAWYFAVVARTTTPLAHRI